jgi:four helix bundle protein
MKKELLEQNAILKLSFDFSLMVIGYCEKLEAIRKFVIANQLLKSGTSIGANAVEAQNAESKADFIHKMKLAAKEAEETQYWLMFCEYSQNFPECKDLVTKLDEIQKVLSRILSTSKRNNHFDH